ncbi:hypothetical protein SAMN05421874_12891 [Nonomuraea maritima]|uniref:Uncharacterized protein n=1 Tax=Nonomuraea maritima TaxID=683260 RepID=A0A1G9MM69_9ACTN|nr:hypothetical protein [Nonomuraea maritima]SDL75121.1 hypothetical protein SAMN05421874_12891 [Nonomuraea maritima]
MPPRDHHTSRIPPDNTGLPQGLEEALVVLAHDICVCGKPIVLMGNGKYRSTEWQLAVDRLKCLINRYHRPATEEDKAAQTAQVPAPHQSTRRIRVTAPCNRPTLGAGDWM